MISIADSQILRWIDELNGISDANEKAQEVRREIRRLKREPNSIRNRSAIKKKYAELDSLQFKPDYMCLIIDKEKDYRRACRGFSINGIRYKRLLGTNGGIKNSTIVFVSDRLADELKRRIENGRDPNKELVTAKLEAYKALTCSASNPVSTPRGVLVVNDAETTFRSDIVSLSDADGGEPVMQELAGQEITNNASDGYGLMLPSLAERWSRELHLDYTVGGVNSRFSYEKGMVFTFDFIDFAEKVAGKYIVKDAWGNDVDIRDVEIVLTTSMVKLWDSYKSCEDYVSTSLENGYTFGVTKTCPQYLEKERTTNYQYLQSYNLSDDEIDSLISPTVNEIEDVLSGDWKKTVLFLKGSGLNKRNVGSLDNDYIKALMIDGRILGDPFVQNSIYQLIRNRIDQAKVGTIRVHGNYSIISGDPYLLCQSIFGLEKTGLLKSGEIYNQYWADCGADRLACFRAPMTCHNNIRLVRSVDNPDVRYWYRYIHTSTILNNWDTATAALNGADYDGDQVMLTDNDILVNKLSPLPALMCIQRKAGKKISTEEDFVQSNIDSFGNDIGQTTNWITSMFEVRSQFPEDSEEFKVLSYRIRCGQLYQQNAIDKAKGIVCNPMPREWHDRHAANKIEDEKKRALYRSIVADRKPYFMRYIYPALMKQYNTYIKNTNRNAMREFQMTVDELKAIPESRRSERQAEFLRYYDYRMPVGTHDCVMNRICRRFEDRFDGYVRKHGGSEPFDYTIMKSDAEYTSSQYYAVRKLMEEYNRHLVSYSVFADYERVNEIDSAADLSAMNEEFRKACSSVCSDSKALCNIILDLCYKKDATKRFAWNMCGDDIIDNLLAKHNHRISYPAIDPDGDIHYCGETYTLMTKEIDIDDDRTE